MITPSSLEAAQAGPGKLPPHPTVVALAEGAVTSLDELRLQVLSRAADGARLVALLARPDARELVAIVARDDRHELTVLRGALRGTSYLSLSQELPAAQLFEREIFECHGIRPEGHPWLRPVRRHGELEGPGARPSEYPFFQVAGAGVHEVAVGPVHAGIIEPGHFRFQCAGEEVLHLEIQLGYQHRGAEALLCTSSPSRRLAVAESIAGDTVVGHATAYAHALEALGGLEVPLRAQALRAIALELERLANHVGDLGALCNDVGFLPGAAWLGRLRGECLGMLASLSGSRYGRGLVCLGGVNFDLDEAQRRELLTRIGSAATDIHRTIALVLDTPSVVSRFEQTGPLPRELGEAVGLVGPAARACGCDRDVRRDHPAGWYRTVSLPVALEGAGDVLARARVRVREIESSLALACEELEALPEGPISATPRPLEPKRLVASLVEGWRGEIAHVAVTDDRGMLCSYKVVDPSFHNWFGLALAMRGEPISDFPLCNKSFNLSYAGHDL